MSMIRISESKESREQNNNHREGHWFTIVSYLARIIMKSSIIIKYLNFITLHTFYHISSPLWVKFPFLEKRKNIITITSTGSLYVISSFYSTASVSSVFELAPVSHLWVQHHLFFIAPAIYVSWVPLITWAIYNFNFQRIRFPFML